MANISLSILYIMQRRASFLLSSRLHQFRLRNISLTLEVFLCLLVTYLAAHHWTISNFCILVCVYGQGLFLGGDSERLAHFFAENLTENDLMGGKISPKYEKNNALKLNLSIETISHTFGRMRIFSLVRFSSQNNPCMGPKRCRHIPPGVEQE